MISADAAVSRPAAARHLAGEAARSRWLESDLAFRCAVPDTADEAANRLEHALSIVRPKSWAEPDDLEPLVDELKACAKALRSRKAQPGLAARVRRLSADADWLAGTNACMSVLIRNTVRGVTKPRKVSG